MKLKDRLHSWTICTMNTNTGLSGKFSKKSRTKSHLPPPMWEKTPQKNAAKHGLLILNHLLGKEVDETCSPEDAFFSNKVAHCLPIKRGPFEIEELKRSLKKLQNTKSPGPDKILAIIWKSPLFRCHLLHFCNETKSGNKPKAFSHSSVLPLPKKGDLSSPANYGGITLSDIASKIYNSMLLNRIAEHVDPILRRSQKGLEEAAWLHHRYLHCAE